MSDLQADVLGKHERDDMDDDDASVEKQPKVEESDDDSGPMPLPASEAPSGKKKKRKGTGTLLPGYCLLLSPQNVYKNAFLSWVLVFSSPTP